MQTNMCPKVNKCPIFQGTSFEGYELNNNLQEIYKTNYCLAGEYKFKNCKRYVAAEALGVPIPKMIMPNSPRTIEEIKLLIEKSKN